jgi:hypothetical protein
MGRSALGKVGRSSCQCSNLDIAGALRRILDEPGDTPILVTADLLRLTG